MAVGLHTRLSLRHDCTQSCILTCPFHFGGQRGCGKKGLRRDEKKADSGKRRIEYDRKKKGGGFSEYAVWYTLGSHPFIFNDCKIIDAGMCRLLYIFFSDPLRPLLFAINFDLVSTDDQHRGGKNRGIERQQSDRVEKGKERQRDMLALPCSRINKASHGKLSEAGYEREGGGERSH